MKIDNPQQTHEIWNLRFLNQIMNSMADGVFTMDAKGSIISWNQSMVRISGYSAEEALGRTSEIPGCSRCFGKECPAGIHSCGILERESTEAKECQVRHKGGYIDVEDLPLEIRHFDRSDALAEPRSQNGPNRERQSGLTRKKLLELLQAFDWNKSKVGRHLNLSHTAIWKYMQKCDIPLKQWAFHERLTNRKK